MELFGILKLISTFALLYAKKELGVTSMDGLIAKLCQLVAFKDNMLTIALIFVFLSAQKIKIILEIPALVVV